MKLKPLFDRVVLKPKQNEEKTLGGIVLPSVAQEKSQIATVTAVGEGGLVDGKQVEMKVKVGDVVLYSKYAGLEFEDNFEKFVICRQADILAIVE